MKMTCLGMLFDTASQEVLTFYVLIEEGLSQDLFSPIKVVTSFPLTFF